MEKPNNKCKLCGSRIKNQKESNQRWCEDCKGGIELISYLRDNFIPITEETIINNIEKFMVERPIEEFIYGSNKVEKYLELNYSVEQYEKIKARSNRIRKKLKLI